MSDDTMRSQDLEEAIGAAIAEVCQKHGAVPMDWLGVVTYARLEGDDTSEQFLFVDSGVKVIQALGLGRLVEGWLDEITGMVLSRDEVED